MRTIFLSFTLLFTFTFTFCQEVVAPKSYMGSALCGDLKFFLELPAEIQGKFNYQEVIAKSDTGNYLLIDYFLISAETDSLKHIHSSLNEFFKEVDHSRPENLSWKIKTRILMGDKVVFQKIANLFPFENCFKIRSNCKQLAIFRHFLVKDCEGYDYHSNLSAAIHLDSVLLYYNFSDEVFSNTCTEDSTDWIKKTDSLTIQSVQPGLYQTFHGTIPNLCNNAPCPPEFIYNPVGSPVRVPDCILNTLSIQNRAEDIIYPNPANTFLYIRSFHGKAVFSNQLGNQYFIEGKERYDISHLKKGFYLISYEKEGQVMQGKVLIR